MRNLREGCPEKYPYKRLHLPVKNVSCGSVALKAISFVILLVMGGGLPLF